MQDGQESKKGIRKRFFGKSMQDMREESAREKREEEERQRKLEEKAREARIAAEQAQKAADAQAREKQKKQAEYQKSLEGLSKEELDSSFEAFTKHPDFERILNEVETIGEGAGKWSYIVRRAYEIGQEAEIPIGWKFQNNPVETKRKLEDYGLHLLCPYFRENAKTVTKEECLIDGVPILSACNGEYYRCVVFEDRARKAAAGLHTLPVISRKEPKFPFRKIPVDPIDLINLDDWWKKEGKYG